MSKEQHKTQNTKKQAKKEKTLMTAPKTTTDSIPYVSVYENGVIEVRKGFFSKSYQLPDVNFKLIAPVNQEQMATTYAELISSFGPEIDVEITMHNRTVDVDEFERTVFLEPRNDDLNEYRTEYNQMLKDKMQLSKNNLTTDKYLTITIPAYDIFEANEKFTQIDETVRDAMSLITRTEVQPLNIIDRLDILNHIYNGDFAVPLQKVQNIHGTEIQSFSLENCAKQGITTKEAIGPSYIKRHQNYIQIGEDTLVKSYAVSNYPTWIKGTIVTDFTALASNALISLYFNTMNQEDAIKFVRRQGVNVASKIVSTQKKSVGKGIDPSLISPSTQADKENIDSLLDTMTKEDVKLVSVSFVITIFGKDEQELKTIEQQVKSLATKNLISIQPLTNLHEMAFNHALPLGNKQLQKDRLMTSQSIASMIPFDVKEIRKEKGMYYGLNAVSKNMILHNRSQDTLNPNACILGMPGSGKSFAAKRELINVLLNTEDEVYVLDPERDYTPIAEAMNGSIVKIANGSNSYINPFDLNLQNTSDDKGDPVKVKSDFIETICEIMVGGKLGLTPLDLSIINRACMAIYEPFVLYLKKSGKTQDMNKAPVMKDFYQAIVAQPYPEAQNLALSLERFVKGSLDIFSHHTNVDVDNRFVVYDIKDVGGGLKELASHIALDHVWNKTIENFYRSLATWIYIDEFHLMTQKESSIAYVSSIWKRARKWRGIPCALTQNVEDMLKSPETRTIINNCALTMLLGQAPMNKLQLSELLGISTDEQKYIAAAKPGMGLLRIHEDSIPFDDSFPRNTKLYSIMTTKPEERQ